jgi:hypothetical protein
MDFLSWLETHTWVAEWLGIPIAIVAIVGPSLAKYFRVDRNMVTTQGQSQMPPILSAIVRALISATGLMVVAIILAINLLIEILHSSLGCMALYLSALVVVIVEIASALQTEKERT